MAKFEKASEDAEKFFEEVREKTTIPQWIEFRVLCNNKQKIPVDVKKNSDLVEVLTEGVNFAVIFNEEIFDQLPDDMKEIAVVEKLAGVSVDDNDKITLVKEDFNTYTGVLQKYGDDPIIRFKESVKSLYDKKKQAEDEAKAAKKGKRGKKRTGA
jgi:hypothetical protein